MIGHVGSLKGCGVCNLQGIGMAQLTATPVSRRSSVYGNGGLGKPKKLYNLGVSSPFAGKTIDTLELNPQAISDLMGAATMGQISSTLSQAVTEWMNSKDSRNFDADKPAIVSRIESALSQGDNNKVYAIASPIPNEQRFFALLYEKVSKETHVQTVAVIRDSSIIAKEAEKGAKQADADAQDALNAAKKAEEEAQMAKDVKNWEEAKLQEEKAKALKELADALLAEAEQAKAVAATAEETKQAAIAGDTLQEIEIKKDIVKEQAVLLDRVEEIVDQVKEKTQLAILKAEDVKKSAGIPTPYLIGGAALLWLLLRK